MPLFCLNDSKETRVATRSHLPFVLLNRIHNFYQLATVARNIDTLSRILRFLVSLIGIKTSLCGALRVYRKVNPTIYDLQ